jgi:BirA family biotin operon repressor/biotin-[acetyl-CoA-carboxylase] ligase
MAQVYAGLARHGSAYFAQVQTAGKGQRGNTWQTGWGENIALSVVLSPAPLPVTQQFRLSVAVALACYDFFSGYAGEDTAIKWPNDLYWRDRKAGGILIENSIGTGGRASGSTEGGIWKYAVAGIGININQSAFGAGLSRAVSLRQITGQSRDVEKLGRELHLAVLERVRSLPIRPFAALLEEYNSRLFRRNQSARLRKGNIEFETVIREVTADGQLFTTDRIDNFFSFGEVEWVL